MASLVTSQARRAGATTRLASSLGHVDATAMLLASIYVLTLFLPTALFVPVGSLQITATRLVGIVAFPVLVMGRKIRWVWPDLVMLSVFASSLLSFAITGGIGQAIESQGRSFLDLGLAYLIGRYVAQHPASLRQILTLLVTVLTCLAPFVLIESVAGVNIPGMLWGALGAGAHVFNEQRMGLTRAMGWTSHPIMLGLTYAMFLSVTVHAAWSRTNLVGRYAWGKAAALMVGVFCSMSSGAWIAAIIVLALLGYEKLAPLPSKFKWWLAFVGAPLAYVLLDMLSGRPLARIIMMRFHISSGDAWYYRWMLRERVMSTMPGHEWLGHGLAIPEEFTRTTGWSIDNTYLLTYFLFGTLGLTVWVGMMATTMFWSAKSVWFSQVTPLRRVTQVMCFTIVAMALAQYSVAFFSTAAALFWMLLGMCVSLGALCMQIPQRRARQVKNNG